MLRHHCATHLTGGGLAFQLVEDARPPSMKGSSHAWAGSALSIRTKLPLAAKGQSSSASSNAHAFGLQGARWIAFDVLTRKRHCSTPSAARHTEMCLILQMLSFQCAASSGGLPMCHSPHACSKALLLT